MGEGLRKSTNLKYDPRLSENQIDELKAEGLEPRDPEYDMYLRNTLGLKPQSEKKNNNNTFTTNISEIVR